MKPFILTYKPFGNSAVLIEWPPEMSESILEDLIIFYEKIKLTKPKSIVEVIQSINSLTIVYDSKQIHFDKLKQWLEKTYSKSSNEKSAIAYYLWKVPVCYDPSFGIDLEDMAQNNNLSVQKIIELHTLTAYRVYSIGFLPGFLYLGGLDERLHIARKAEPRLVVQKGTVGIGGSQTGIYPKSSPGGWHLIGSTPISFFDKTKKAPCFAKPGDKIQFISITLNEYAQIQGQVAEGNYILEREALHD